MEIERKKKEVLRERKKKELMDKSNAESPKKHDIEMGFD